MAYSEEALDAVARVGLLTSLRQIDHNAAADRIIEALDAHAGESEEEALSTQQLAFEVFKLHHSDLRRLTNQLCALRAGKVQKRLNGDHRMLCGSKRTEELDDADQGPTTVTLSTRWLDSDPAHVSRFLLDGQKKRFENGAIALDELYKLAVQRIPELAEAVRQKRLETFERTRGYVLGPGQ
jgi:hypothetical protein